MTLGRPMLWIGDRRIDDGKNEDDYQNPGYEPVSFGDQIYEAYTLCRVNRYCQDSESRGAADGRAGVLACAIAQCAANSLHDGMNNPASTFQKCKEDHALKQQA